LLKERQNPNLRKKKIKKERQKKKGEE